MLLLGALTAAAYLPAVHGGYILDDNYYLTDVALIKAPDGLVRFWFTFDAMDYYPVSNSTLWLEWRLWGMDPTGYHVTNLVLHVAAALLIWTILRKLSVPGAYLAALLFAVHPANVESVAWISQRKGLLAMVFFLLSILWYLLDEDRRNQRSHARPLRLANLGRFYWLSLLAFTLAMLSKGSVGFLPIVLLGLVWWQHRRITADDLRRTVPFFLVAVGLTALNVLFQNRSVEAIREASFAQRLLGAGGAIWFYLYKALWPSELIFVYPQWRIEPRNLAWWLPLAAAVAVSAILWWRRDRSWGRMLLVAWGFFCVALLPVLGFVDVGYMKHTLVADHYQYVAIVAPIAIVSAAWGYLHLRAAKQLRAAAVATAAAAVLVLAGLSWRQSQQYENAITLYRATLEKNPDAWLAHNNLAVELNRAGRTQDAIEQFRVAIERVPETPELYNGLGMVLASAGRWPEAVQQYQEALRHKPNYGEAHSYLGMALVKIGQLDEGTKHLAQALRITPDARAYNNMGAALAEQGKYEEAIAQYKKALALKADFADAHMNLAVALANTGKAQEALDHIQRALEFNYDVRADLETAVAIALAKIGRIQEAIDHYDRALEINPELFEARNNLAWLLATTESEQFRNPSRAVELAKRAAELKPASADAANTLGISYYRAGDFKAAILWLDKAIELRGAGTAYDWFFLAMAHERVGQHNEARLAYENALQWMNKHAPTDDQLVEFRREAEQILNTAEQVRNAVEK
jgi:tetratricopeptide (TPR) repeat protein